MFNLKQAQRQGLLFYPWMKTHVNTETGHAVEETQRASDIYNPVSPVNIDQNTGEKFYKCHLCSKVISEHDVEHWEKRDDVIEQFTYPQTSNGTMLAEDLRHLQELVVPYMEEFKKHKAEVEQEVKDGKILYYQSHERLSSWEIEVPDVMAFLQSSKDIQDFCQFERATTQWGSYEYVCRLLRSSTDKLNGTTLGNLSQHGFMTDTEATISTYLSRNADPNRQKLDIKQIVPICEECLEDIDKCEFCDKPILEDDQKWEITYNDAKFVCEQCVEDGHASVCDTCGKADSAEEIQYIEDFGSFCDECVKELTSVDAYRYQIENASAGNEFPFSDWFPDGENRLSIPFISSDELSGMDKYIRQYLDEKGCSNTSLDYQEGYCHYQGRKFKIVRFLSKVLQDKIKEIKNYDWDEEAKENKIEEMHTHFEELAKGFMTSEFRKLKEKENTQSKFRQLNDTEDLQVVITQDPDDIATISGGTRPWHSHFGNDNCMSLGVGMYYENVFCYIEHGFLAAYLTRKGDDTAEDALARILIRRLENKDGVSIAVAESSVYGNAPVGFREFVSEWLQAKQTNLPKGLYERVESAYSDSKMDDYEKTAARLLAEAMMKNSHSNWYKKIKYA